LIFSGNVSSFGEGRGEVSHLAAGVYFVEIETIGGDKVVKKMVKK